MSAKQAVVQVIYPSGPDATFDMDYYLNKHMPMVDAKWGSSGLKHWTIITAEKGEDWLVQAHLIWESVEAFQSAGDKETVMGDIPNFTNTKPTLKSGSIVATSS
ncbi:hypothetical protein CC79DRAFT_1320333 [Sarocladium strictum]|jgi:uncharacterized protein (TIGR02118 family)